MKRLMKKNMLMKMMLKKVPREKMLLSDDDWDDDQDKDEDVGGAIIKTMAQQEQGAWTEFELKLRPLRGWPP